MSKSTLSVRKRAALLLLVFSLCFHSRAGAQRGRITEAVYAFVLTRDGDAVIGGMDRAWVAKRTLDGDEELFRVELGSDSRDSVNAVAADAGGKIYAAGTIYSNGMERGFIATLNNDGNRTSFTALPSPAYALAVDVEGKVYVAGGDYVLLPGGSRIAPPGPVRALGINENGIVYAAGRKPSLAETGSYGDDAYVAKLADSQDRWEWLLPLGGTGAVEEARAIAFDGDGAVYVAGVTNSVDFPVKAAFQEKLNGLQDVFLVKVSLDGQGVDWSTYLGGRGLDSVAAMVVDHDGEILLAGSTNSPDFPSAGRWGGGEDGFLARFDAKGKLLGSDYLGASNADGISGIAIDGNGRVYVSGSRLREVAKPAARMAGTTSSSTVLAATPNPSIFGAPVTLTATITAGATGQVTFYDGTTVLGLATVSGNKATFSTILLPSGSRALRAYYAGDSSYASSTSAAVTQTVSVKPGGGFLAPTNYLTGAGATSIAVGDFNGDGKADLVTAVYSTGANVMLGNGNGSFQAAISYEAGQQPVFVAVADFNGDGKSDLAIAHNIGSDVSVFLGNGNGTFQPAVRYTLGAGSRSLAVADFNEDGKPDLAVVVQGAENVVILLGKGDGTFQSPLSYKIAPGAANVAVGDFNGDGKPDLVVTIDSLPGRVLILLGNGDGTFQSALSSGAGSFAVSVAVGDFNGDGKADLAVTNLGAGALIVLLGNGDGTFQTAMSYGVGTTPKSVTVGDFNGDGKLDLAVVNYASNNVSIHYGNGNGTFRTAMTYGVGTHPIGLAVGDFNGDGRLDLAETNYDDGSVGILLGVSRPDNIGTAYGGYSALDANGNFAWDGTTTDKLISWSTGQAGEVPIYGDWNGDGRTKAGVFLNGTWILDYNGNGVWDGPTVDKVFSWSTGQPSEVPVFGDWNGDGRIKAGIFNNGTWILDYNGNGLWEGPGVDKTIYWSMGQTGEVPVIGDWNGDGKTKIGVHRNGTWILDYNGNYAWDGTGIDKLVFFGGPGYTPMVGDWNGSGWTKIGAYLNGTWVIDFNGNFAWDGTLIDKLTFFGGPEFVPVVGDWNASGSTKIGAYSNALWLLDVNGNFTWDPPADQRFIFGVAGQKPIVGKW